MWIEVIYFSRECKDLNSKEYRSSSFCLTTHLALRLVYIFPGPQFLESQKAINTLQPNYRLWIGIWIETGLISASYLRLKKVNTSKCPNKPIMKCFSTLFSQSLTPLGQMTLLLQVNFYCCLFPRSKELQVWVLKSKSYVNFLDHLNVSG